MASLYNILNSKPAYGARINTTDPIGSLLATGYCIPFLGPDGPLYDACNNVDVSLFNAGFIGQPVLNWQRAVSNSGNAAYLGGSSDWVIASGWLDSNQNLLASAPVRTYTCTLGTTNAILTFMYGNVGSGNISPSGGVITASQIQTALIGMTTIGSGNATCTGASNGPFTITLTSPATWPGDLTASGAANPGLQNWLPNAGIWTQWNPQIISQWQTIPTGFCAIWVIKPSDYLASGGIKRCGDTQEGLGWGLYTGLTNGKVGIPYYEGGGNISSYSYNLGDWLVVHTSQSANTLDVWINGTHQTQVTGSSLTNFWTSNIGTGANSAVQSAINTTLNGPGSTLQGRGTPTNQVNNQGIALAAFGYNNQLTDALVQQHMNDGLYCFLYPSRPSFSFYTGALTPASFTDYQPIQRPTAVIPYD
jgi:hypothetical protein